MGISALFLFDLKKNDVGNLGRKTMLKKNGLRKTTLKKRFQKNDVRKNDVRKTVLEFGEKRF